MRHKRRAAAAALGLPALAVYASVAQAQFYDQAQFSGAPLAPPTDKSGYTLFDPTPESQLRTFSTDRTNKGSSPYTVDTGHFRYETDLLCGSYDDDSRSRLQVGELFAADPVLKLGITNLADVEISLGGYQAYSGCRTARARPQPNTPASATSRYGSRRMCRATTAVRSPAQSRRITRSPR